MKISHKNLLFLLLLQSLSPINHQTQLIFFYSKTTPGHKSMDDKTTSLCVPISFSCFSFEQINLRLPWKYRLMTPSLNIFACHDMFLFIFYSTPSTSHTYNQITTKHFFEIVQHDLSITSPIHHFQTTYDRWDTNFKVRWVSQVATTYLRLQRRLQ